MLHNMKQTDRLARVLRGQDIVVLLHLVGKPEGGSVREVADAVGFDVGGTHRALRRLAEAGLYSAARGRVPEAQAQEFLLHGVKYVFPAVRGSETRGVLTAWAASPLAERLAPSGELPPVWPHPDGEVRGIALEPLHAIAPQAALGDAGLWERLALVDALRAGDVRARTIAAELLIERLTA